MSKYVTADDYDKMTPWFRQQVKNNQFEIPTHLQHATSMTKYGHINYSNRKSYKAVERVQSIRSVRQEEAENTIVSSAQ